MPAPVVIPTQADLPLSPEDGTSKTSSEYLPRVTGLPNGGFVAIWADFLPGTNDSAPNYPYGRDADGQMSMMVRAFGPDGKPIARAFPAASDFSGVSDAADIVTLSGGQVLAAWSATTNTSSRIGARITDPQTGLPVGAEIAVARGGGSSTFTDLKLIQAVALPEGRAGVLYLDQGADPNTLRLALVQPDGTLGANRLVASTGLPSSAGNEDVAVALQGSNTGILAIITQQFPAAPKVEYFKLDGTQAALPALSLGSTGSQATLAALPNGGLAIAMASGSTSFTVIRTDAAGARVGTDLNVPAPGVGSPDLLALPDGGLLLTVSAGAAFNAVDIVGQRIKADGTLDGAAVRLDAAPAGPQTSPALALTGDGSVVVAFVDERSALDSGIRAARLDLGLGAGTTPADTTAPKLKSSAPAASAKAVKADVNLALIFDEPVQLGAGQVVLKTAAGQVLETFGATSTQLSIKGDTLTIDPKADLPVLTDVVLELGAGAVRDAAGNALASSTTIPFRTATVDGLYHFFVVAFAAAPGATYMGQLAEAWNHFSAQPTRPDNMPVLQQIVEIFTTKKQFTDVYPTTLSNRELATQLVNNIVKTSASATIKQTAIDDIDAALGIGWSRGKMLYTVFGNLANKPLTDATWGNTAKQFQNQLAVARHFTEEMGVATESLTTLRGVIGNVTPTTDVSTTDKIVQIIGTPPPGG